MQSGPRQFAAHRRIIRTDRTDPPQRPVGLVFLTGRQLGPRKEVENTQSIRSQHNCLHRKVERKRVFPFPQIDPRYLAQGIGPIGRGINKLVKLLSGPSVIAQALGRFPHQKHRLRTLWNRPKDRLVLAIGVGWPVGCE